MESSSAVIEECSRGSFRKYQTQTTSQARLATLNMTKAPRQETKIMTSIINAGVKAFPIRAKECTRPCAKAQFLLGVQVAIARVAVGNVAP